jgi:hypothetical protein
MVHQPRLGDASVRERLPWLCTRAVVGAYASRRWIGLATRQMADGQVRQNNRANSLSSSTVTISRGESPTRQFNVARSTLGRQGTNCRPVCALHDRPAPRAATSRYPTASWSSSSQLLPVIATLSHSDPQPDHEPRMQMPGSLIF